MKYRIRFRAFYAIFCILFFTRCSQTPLTEEQKIYAGRWNGADNSLITIETTGRAGYVFGSSRVQGGSIAFTDSSFTISIFGMEKYFKIDEPPLEKEEITVMKLNGTEYRKINWSE